MNSIGGDVYRVPADEDSSTATATPPTPYHLDSVPEDKDAEKEEQQENTADGGLLDNDADDVTSKSQVSSARVPKLQSRARLVRTPATKTENETPSEDHRTNENESVTNDILITELKQSEYADKDVLEIEKAEEDVFYSEKLVEGDVEYEENQEPDGVELEPVEYTEKEEDCDTDLEIEEFEVPEHDPTGRLEYKRLCERLGVVPVSYFARHITDHEITMRWHGLGPVAAKAIALVMRDNITCEKLNIQGNWIEQDGAEAMARMLEENDYIADLNIADNKIGRRGAECFTKMLGFNAGLRKLDLSGNGFDDKDAPLFAQMLENAKYLKEINLSRNQFGEEGGVILGPAIGKGGNDILEVIDLSWNHLRGRGAIAVAKGVQENVILKVCRLGWNGFGPEGGKAIADALTQNNALLEMDVSGNRLDAESALRMAKMLTTNENIRTLRMGNNLITTAGAIQIATAINATEGSSLELLDFTDIPIEFEFLRILEDIKSKRSNFKVIHGPIMRSGNTAEDLGKRAIDPYKRKEPVLVLQSHIVVNDMRLLDVLKKYDPDGSLHVTPEDFVTAVEDLAVPFNKPKLQEAVMKVADTQNGRIYFGDFIDQDKRQQSQQNSSNGQTAGTDVES